MIESYASKIGVEKHSTLVINLNEEYKIKIENGNYFNTSIFKDVYHAALKNVEEIVRQSSNGNYYDDFNNIIAFAGERGKGKSSSMISFRDALIEKEGDNHKKFFSKESAITNKKFATIEIIDPSLFRGGESLFEIILAQMFQKFQDAIRCQDSSVNDDDRRGIIKHFQEVFENLLIINSNRKDLYKKESIEVLSRLATSSNLRKCFKELVSIYLQKFESRKDFLVIAIDDFDLNISDSYNMLEDIRQFLVQSKIILLIACKIEQLREAIELYYSSQNIRQIEAKSKRYLDKIIPFSRRIELPDVRNLTQKDFKILENSTTVFEAKNNNFKINILKLIFDKLELFQPLDQLGQNLAIPETIRQTQNFVNLILAENSVEKLIKYVVEESGSSDLKGFIAELEIISDDLFLLVLSKKIIEMIPSKIGTRILDKIVLKNTNDETFRAISNALISSRLSIGDINFLLKEYENSIPIDKYNTYTAISLLKFYISLRIKRLLSNDRKVLKYGFSNDLIKILPRENGNTSRDSMNFTNSINDELSKLNNKDRIFFALWVQNLGDGYKDYRQNLHKDIYVESYRIGKLSPIALLNNIFNLNELSIYIGFDLECTLIEELKEWFDKSIFIKQLSNPSFNLKFFDYLRLFRNLELKDSLPTNYFDTICLLFNYGILYSLNKIEQESNIVGLVYDYLDNPVFKSMLYYFDSKEYAYKIVNDLNKEYDLNEEHKDFEFSDNVVRLLNSIYESNKEENLTNSPHKKEPLPTYAISILSNLKWYLENRKITSRLVGNRVAELRDFESIDKEKLNRIESLKFGLNGDVTYEDTKNELITIVNELLYG